MRYNFIGAKIENLDELPILNRKLAYISNNNYFYGIV